MERAVAALAGRHFLFACAVLAGGFGLAAFATPEPAHAQGLFDVLRGIFGGHRPRIERPEPPRLLEGFPEDGIEQVPEEGGGPYVAYCVRLCDGRYFPLPRNAGAPTMTPAQVCSAMCPAAQTKVFSGTSINAAAAEDGKSYTSLANAFVYRDRTVADCSCTGDGTTGVASMRVEDDPTLRRGDIVVTAEGVKVFTGDQRPPHKAREFTPVEQYKGLPKSLRQQLSEMRISEIPERLPDAGRRPQSAPDAAPPETVGPHASLQYAPTRANPVADAFADFRR